MARLINPFIQYLDGSAQVLDGSEIFFFEPGTTTPKDTFSDSALSIANTNPVVADSDGYLPAIFTDGLYKVVLKDKAGLTLYTANNVGEESTGQFELWVNGDIYNIPEIVLGSDDNYYRSLIDSNQGNDPTSSPSSWEQIEFERIYNANITYALGDRVIGSDGMLYFSLTATNLNNDPTTETTDTKWRSADQMRSADATGTVDVITATYIPAVGALKEGLTLRLRAAGANTVTTPTFAPNGLTAKTIVKEGNQALVAGDIGAADHELLLVYNSSNDVWELLNPVAPVYSLMTTTALSATTSGTEIDITGLPAGIKQFTVNLAQVSCNATFALVLQLGDSGGFETSGYQGSVSAASNHTSWTSSVRMRRATGAASEVLSGSVLFTLMDEATNLWAVQGVLAETVAAFTWYFGGSKSLSGELTQVRLTTDAGTPVFDNGNISITYIV